MVIWDLNLCNLAAESVLYPQHCTVLTLSHHSISELIKAKGLWSILCEERERKLNCFLVWVRYEFSIEPIFVVEHEFPGEQTKLLEYKLLKIISQINDLRIGCHLSLLCDSVLYWHRLWALLGLPPRHSFQSSLHQTAEFGWDWPTASFRCGPISVSPPIPVTGSRMGSNQGLTQCRAFPDHSGYPSWFNLHNAWGFCSLEERWPLSPSWKECSWQLSETMQD